MLPLRGEYPPRRKVRGNAKRRVATRSGSSARDLLRVTHRPAEVRVTRAGASPAVFSESCVAAIVVVCAGGSLRAVEGSGRWSPRDFGESSGGWSACGRATRVYRSDAGPSHLRQNLPNRTEPRGRAGPVKISSKRSAPVCLFSLHFCIFARDRWFGICHREALPAWQTNLGARARPAVDIGSHH